MKTLRKVTCSGDLEIEFALYRGIVGYRIVGFSEGGYAPITRQDTLDLLRDSFGMTLDELRTELEAQPE